MRTNTNLYSRMREIISTKIHLRKCETDLSREQWNVLDSRKIAEDVLAELLETLESYLYLPCCHVSGIHDPVHYEERKYICESQKAEAFTRFCSDLGVNPTVRMRPSCTWCEHYPEKRRGEGLRLFQDKEELCTQQS